MRIKSTVLYLLKLKKQTTNKLKLKKITKSLLLSVYLNFKFLSKNKNFSINIPTSKHKFISICNCKTDANQMQQLGRNREKKN